VLLTLAFLPCRVSSVLEGRGIDCKRPLCLSKTSFALPCRLYYKAGV
jgi:hypothetical protein